MAKRSNFSKTFVWIILGLLIVGLAGFGATNLSGTVRTVGTVGDQVISVEDYARELQREIRAIEAQTGQPLQIGQLRALGLDRAVLSRLVALAAIDNEVAGLGLSVGDVNLQEEIVAIPAFQNIEGRFDRETYRFALSQAGITEAEFEADLRAEAARTLVQNAILGGARMPPVLVDTLTGYIAARRSFTWARLDERDLAAPLPEPSETDLRSFYDANPESFTLPETKRLSYALLTPEMMLDRVEVEEDLIRALYDERDAEYNQPERRLVERLIYPDEASAAEAAVRLRAGETTFEALVEERGLSLADVDLGDMTAADLDEAADEVFAAEIGEVLGPLPTAIGPSLYRINGILAGRVTPYEDARAELRDELARGRASRLIEARAEQIDDLLAGGATLEDLAAETDMVLERIDWTQESFEGIAAYDGFRTAAATVAAGDFPETMFLEDGGVFALRLDELLPPRPQPFAEVRDRAIEGWTRQETETALRARARDAVTALAGGGDFAAAGFDEQTETGLTRTAYIDGTPADFMTQIFEMDPGELRVISGEGAAFVVRLDGELPPEETEDLAEMRRSFSEELDQSLAQALFDALLRDAQLRARPRLDQRALNAVQAGFQ